VIRFAGWVGAAAMVAAPPFIDTAQGKALAIVGLLLLTIQAAKLRAHNLIVLNIGGILGYSYALYF
jgi:hypothetical protein